MKIILGCGNILHLYPGYEGLDIIDFGQAYVGDILEFLQAKEENDFNCPEYWEEVMANHFLEHFTQEELKIIFSGVHKMLQKDGIFRFVVPHKDAAKSWILTHKTFWNEETVYFLTEKNNEDDFHYGFGKWKLVELITNDKKDMHVILRKVD